MARFEYSEEERKRRSDRAKDLVRQGKIGGAQYGRLGGRPRKPRVSEMLAEEANKQYREILAVYKDAIQKGVPIRDRLAAADKWVQVEQREEMFRQAEERAFEGLHRDKLIEELTGTLRRLAEAGVPMPEIVEGEAEEMLELESGNGDGTHEAEMPDD